MKKNNVNINVGQCFDQWAITSYSHKNGHYQHFWNCKCICGYESTLEQSRLVNGRSTKCGTCANALRRKYQPVVLDKNQYAEWRILYENEEDKCFVFAQCK